MIVIVTASADTYITDKLIDGKSQVSGNVGSAGTIDIFKLYDESYQVTGALEVSRGLMRFDYSGIRSLTGSTLDLNNFRATLRLRNVSSGHPTPHDFTLSLFPLAVDFREGLGRDVSSFTNVDAANFLSSSTGILWNSPGANEAGDLGDTGIDYIGMGDLQDGLGMRSMEMKQYFETGLEDLNIDVTAFVSASMVGILPYPCLRLAFTGSEESDSLTRFVKRFAARNAKEVLNRPRITISFDDSSIDDRGSMFFDTSGSLYISNTVRGVRTNFTSGSSLAPVTGDDCIILRLSTGSYAAYFTGSQANATGLYVANCIITSGDAGIVTGSLTIADYVNASGSITFNETWMSPDHSVTYRNSSLSIRKSQPFAGFYDNEKLVVHCDGPQSAPGSETVMIRARTYDLAFEDTSAKYAYVRKPVRVTGLLYRIIDLNGGEVIVDYDQIGTKASCDENGNFFMLPSSTIPPGRPVTFEFLATYNGVQRQLTASGYTFTRES